MKAKRMDCKTTVSNKNKPQGYRLMDHWMSESILTTDRKYRYYYVITRFIRFWIHFWKSHSACSMSVRVSAWLCPRFFSPPPSSATANFRIVSEILVSFFWLTNRFRSAVKLQGPEKRSSAYAGKKGRKEESCK